MLTSSRRPTSPGRTSTTSFANFTFACNQKCKRTFDIISASLTSVGMKPTFITVLGGHVRKWLLPLLTTPVLCLPGRAVPFIHCERQSILNLINIVNLHYRRFRICQKTTLCQHLSARWVRLKYCSSEPTPLSGNFRVWKIWQRT